MKCALSACLVLVSLTCGRADDAILKEILTEVRSISGRQAALETRVAKLETGSAPPLPPVTAPVSPTARCVCPAPPVPVVRCVAESYWQSVFWNVVEPVSVTDGRWIWTEQRTRTQYGWEQRVRTVCR